MDGVVHFEIPADDLQRAQGFYGDVFDWNLNSMPDMGYVMVTTTETDEKTGPKNPGAINGGMMKREELLTNPVITISVASIDEAAGKIASAGGTMVRDKMPIMDMGFAAYFKDPEGNILGLWENAPSSG